MPTPRFHIVATLVDTGERFFCFTWCRDEASGLARAQALAVRFDMIDALCDFRAEPIH